VRGSPIVASRIFASHFFAFNPSSVSWSSSCLSWRPWPFPYRRRPVHLTG